MRRCAFTACSISPVSALQVPSNQHIRPSGAMSEADPTVLPDSGLFSSPEDPFPAYKHEEQEVHNMPEPPALEPPVDVAAPLHAEPPVNSDMAGAPMTSGPLTANLPTKVYPSISLHGLPGRAITLTKT